MSLCTCIEDFSTVSDNKVIGLPEEMVESYVEFQGVNNVVYFDKNVRLESTEIKLYGNNSVVFICGMEKHPIRVVVELYNDNVFYYGKNSNATRPINAVLSERKHLIIGDDCLFATLVRIRNADGHLIYDAETKQRINPSKSIYIGDHVWIGQDALITKGTQIGSGAIVGAKSFTAGKRLYSNCSYGGVPVKMLKQNVFWLKPCVHSFTKRKTKRYNEFEDDRAIFVEDGNQISYTEIERGINALKTSEERVEYLKTHLYDNEDKNIFFRRVPQEKTFFQKVTAKIKRIFKK